MVGSVGSLAVGGAGGGQWGLGGGCSAGGSGPARFGGRRSGVTVQSYRPNEESKFTPIDLFPSLIGISWGFFPFFF